MTITNHIRVIHAHADSVIEHVDHREYRQAHSALDDIANRVFLAHEHIDHLQQVKPRTPVMGGSS